MTGDLISREALMQFPIRIDHYDRENGNEHFISGIETVLEYAQNLPVIDAVPVVRCSECVHGSICFVEDAFERAGIHDGYCRAGKRRGD